MKALKYKPQAHSILLYNVKWKIKPAINEVHNMLHHAKNWRVPQPQHERLSESDNIIMKYTKFLVSQLTTNNFCIIEVPIVVVAVTSRTNSSPDLVDANFNSAFVVH